MNINTDTSPLQRLGIFFVGLFTFVGFGFLAWITFNLSGGDVDSNYEMKSEARALKINEMVANQNNSYIPTDSDFENYIKINNESEQIVSQKPVPGTKTFSEKMAAQMAAQVAAQADSSQSTDPKQEVTKKDELIELTINALADPPGTMKFKETELEIKAGAKVSLTFLNPDVLQHNLVLVDKEKKDAVGALADAMLTDPDALKKNYVPESEDIIASTKLVNPGGVDKIEFVAPSEPGDYPYICTFPGHWRLMQGIIKVKASDARATPEANDTKSSPIAENAKVKDELIELTINALADPPGTMKFKETELEIKAGAKVSLTFLNPDVLQHNLVLVDKEKKDAVGALADAMLTDPDALKKNYVPESEDIIASTKLVNPGGVDKIEFVAPSEPGDYPYICTFPGHWRLMQGIIKVKK